MRLPLAIVGLALALAASCGKESFTGAGKSAQSDGGDGADGKDGKDKSGSKDGKDKSGSKDGTDKSSGSGSGTEGGETENGTGGTGGTGTAGTTGGESTSGGSTGAGDVGDVDAGGISIDTGKVIANNKDKVIFAGFQQSTPAGTGKIGGIPCPAPFTPVASIGDCSGNPTVTCFGNLNFCANKQALKPVKTLTMLLDLALTAEGQHVVGGPACPTGFDQVGGIADCGGGICNGNQKLCAKVAPITALKSGTPVVVDFFMTPENTHMVGAQCPAGFRQIGSMADCGGASGQNGGITGCQGNQVLCVKMEELK